MPLPLPLRPLRLLPSTVLLACFASALPALHAAGPPNRLRTDARLTERTELPQGVPARLQASQALGTLSSNEDLGVMSLVLAPTAVQNAALDQLLADQQNPASPQFHQWLSPVQFGEKFGVSDADLHVLQNWLTSQGFSVVGIPASRNMIQFTGTAASAQTAFSTGFGRFKRGSQTYFSNTSAPTVPAAFSGIIGGVQGLSSYRMQPHSRARQLTDAELQAQLHPELTGTNSAGTVVHRLVPYDVRQIYSANGLVSSGYTGTGVTIAVIGQTAVNATQLATFQTITGQTVKAPNLVLVPNSGTSTTYSTDEGESEGDLEYAGGVAPGATVNFVYTGNSTNADVITALEYAITANLGQIITLSYGGCEQFNGTTYIYTVEPYLRQASAQGQSFVASSGDSGATGCDSDALTTSYDGLAVSYPASSPYVTGVGGTMFVEGTGTYWAASNNSQRGSALGYIPETTWNETDKYGIGATGGGASVVFSKPSWQVGTGVPADGARDTPDVSFAAAAGHDAYQVCTADTTYTGTTSGGVAYTGQCTTTTLGAFGVGGTSFSAPSFAGMLALAEQANGGARLGNLNPTLYQLAATTPAVFNDVTTGSNLTPCASTGIVGCATGSAGYSAGTGYDLATGLGSINMGAFSSAITAAAAATVKVPTLVLSQTALTTTAATYTVTVGSTSTATVPTGTVSLTVDGGTATPVTLASGTATYTVTLATLTAGTHTLRATYAGDGNFSAASTSATFVTGSPTGSFSLSLSPSTLTVASGTTGQTTLSLTSSNYTGLVLYSIAAASGSTVAPGCFISPNGAVRSSSTVAFLDTSVTAGSTVAVGFAYHSLTSDCTGISSNAMPSRDSIFPAGRGGSSPGAPWAAFAFGGCVLGGLALRRRRALGAGLLAVACTLGALGASGCGSGSTPLSTTTPTTTTTTTGTYKYVITAQAYPSGTVTSTTNLTLTVQ